MAKAARRSSPLSLPRWASASLALYLLVVALHPLAGRRLHILPLYLIPVLLATGGGAGPGLAMTAAGSPVVAQLLRNREALTVADVGAAPEWARLVRGLPARRALLAPASSWGKVLACLLFGRGAAAPPFGDRDRRLAEAMAQHVAAALEHAEAFHAIERQADQIRCLNRDLENQN